MHWNNQWQVLLCTALLVSCIACNDGRQTAEAKADQLTDVSPALSDTLMNVAADSTAVTSYEVNGNAAPPSPEQQPQPISPQQQQPSSPKGSAPPAPAFSHPDWDKKIIRNGDLRISIKDFDKYNEVVRAAVKQCGGYVAQEEQTKSEYQIENVMTIKVPVDQFDNAIQLLSPATSQIEVKKITSVDVTAELIDTKSRMESKRVARQRYIELMKQANKMEDVLAAQQEADGVQEQIESAAGRINYLQQHAALSTIHLSYFQVLDATAKKDVNAPPAFGQKMLNAMGDGLSWIGDVVVLLLTIWPLLALVAIGIWAYRKYVSRRIKVTPATTVAPLPPTATTSSHEA